MHHSASSTKSPYKLSGNFPKQWKERGSDSSAKCHLNFYWCRMISSFYPHHRHMPSFFLSRYIDLNLNGFCVFFFAWKKIMHRLWWMKFQFFPCFWEFKMGVFTILENDFQSLLVKIHRWELKSIHREFLILFSFLHFPFIYATRTDYKRI